VIPINTVLRCTNWVFIREIRIIAYNVVNAPAGKSRFTVRNALGDLIINALRTTLSRFGINR